jgi:hypothetical protein
MRRREFLLAVAVGAMAALVPHPRQILRLEPCKSREFLGTPKQLDPKNKRG